MQWEALEREAIALIGVAGAIRAQGADVEVPNLADVRQAFDDWLYSEPAEETDDIMIRRALGLREG